MSFNNRVNQKLHDEHQATLALLDRLEKLLARHRRGSPPQLGDPGLAALFADLPAALEGEVQRHFAFEEDEIFSFLEAAGEAEIGAHLTDEHRVIRPVGLKLAARARIAGGQGFDAPGWDEFRGLAQDLCDRLRAHVDKEEMALLPLLEETMDAETEARLYQEYVENG